MAMVTPMAYHGIPTTPHGVAQNFMARRAATPSATSTALHGNPTESHGNPHVTPMFTAPRLGSGFHDAVEVRGGFGGMPWEMPWKVLPQVVPRHATACREKDNNVHPW